MRKIKSDFNRIINIQLRDTIEFRYANMYLTLHHKHI